MLVIVAVISNAAQIKEHDFLVWCSSMECGAHRLTHCTIQRDNAFELRFSPFHRRRHGGHERARAPNHILTEKINLLKKCLSDIYM